MDGWPGLIDYLPIEVLQTPNPLYPGDVVFFRSALPLSQSDEHMRWTGKGAGRVRPTVSVRDLISYSAVESSTLL